MLPGGGPYSFNCIHLLHAQDPVRTVVLVCGSPLQICTALDAGQLERRLVNRDSVCSSQGGQYVGAAGECAPGRHSIR